MAERIKKLGIMTAMEEEFSLVAKSFEFARSRTIGPRTFLSARYGGLELTLVPSRIGKVAAAVTTSILIHDYEVDAVLFAGVAGGADPSVRIGDIVVADRLIQHDIDLKGVLGYKRFDIPLLDVQMITCCSDLVGIAKEAAKVALSSDDYRNGVRGFATHTPELHTGVIASGDTFMCDASERDALLLAIPGLKCVEMEGAAAAQVCLEHQVPFVVGRVISDQASGTAHLDFGAFITQAAAIGSEAFVRNFVMKLVGEER